MTEKEKEKEIEIEKNLSESSDEENADYSSIKQSTYDPKTSDRIICVELENNQHILVSYTEKSTIKDLIISLLNRHEYKLLNQDRNIILNSLSHLTAFDLNLCFYDDVKPAQENKISEDVLLDNLHILGLLKNHRDPFLVLKQNFAPSKYTYSNQIKKLKLQEIDDTKYNQYAIYFDFLPRMVKWVPNALLAHPEIENFYARNKKCYNEFLPYRRNKLTCEDDNIDWFIYDKESINFLHEMNKTEFKDFAGLKYINGKVYFEDKCVLEEDKNNNASASQQSQDKKDNKKIDKLIANIILENSKQAQSGNSFSKKIEINSKTTALEIIEKMLSKLTMMDDKIKFDPKSKILKVRSQNDYVFDLNEPLINYTYINECLKMNKSPEFLILDNPLLINKDGQTTNIISSSSPSTAESYRMNVMQNSFVRNYDKRTTTNTASELGLAGKNDLENIAMHNPTLDKINNDVLKPSIVLDKFVGKKKTEGGSLDDLINSIDKEIENNLRKEYRDKINNNDTEDPNDENLEELINNENKDINYRENLYHNKFLKDKQNMFLHVNNGNGSLYFQKKKKQKNLQNKTNKNIFLKKKEDKKNNCLNIKPLINPYYLHVSKIIRPFSILIRSADINYDFGTNESEPIILLFKFDLFCSASQIGSSKQIRWVTKNGVRNPLFNKRIYFDISYSQLPNVSSVLFRVKYIPQNTTKQLKKKDIIFWANYRLFDQNDKLKVGLHKVNLHDREVCDDVYFFFSDNPNEKKSNKIYFEIENFVCPIVNKVKYTPVENVKSDEPQLELDNEQLLRILKIDEKSPFDDLNHSEKNILWRNRYGIAKMNSLIPKLFLSADYNNPNANKEYQKIMKLITDLTIVQAIELLSGKYINEIVRTFAVSILKKASISDIKIYLLQLVQALKYEKNIDNSLARFLLETAIANPITIGHEFFWHLRAEMYNQEVQKKFGLYLEVFVNKISPTLYKIFKDEDLMLKTLITYAEKVIKNPSKEDRDKTFKQDLSSLNELYKQKKKEISLPLNFKYRVKGLIVEKCRIMNSKKKPLWLTFENADPSGSPIVCMLKCGDDLRMDMVTLQLFQAMQTIWFENGLQVKMSLYKVLCTGYMQGMLEMVTNSDTLANIHVQEGGAIKQLFSIASVLNWIEKNCKSVSPIEAKENFLMSNVAYCLATFVLGVGDRHNDNIMMKKNGELFHIDFGHFLGHFKYKMGIKRERAPFVFTRQFQYVLGGDDSELFKKFKQKLDLGYSILRKNRDVILTLLRMLLCTGIPELNEKSLKFLETSLAMKKTDKEAIDFIEKKLYESMDSVSTKLNFAIHIVANK